MTGQAPMVFEYALVRVVPRVERGEQLNAGVLVYCRPAGLVRAEIHLDEARLLALDPQADVDAVRQALAAVAAVCFRWLTAPRSTVVQPGPVHCGLTADPEGEAARLLEQLVR